VICAHASSAYRKREKQNKTVRTKTFKLSFFLTSIYNLVENSSFRTGYHDKVKICSTALQAICYNRQYKRSFDSSTLTMQMDLKAFLVSIYTRAQFTHFISVHYEERFHDRCHRIPTNTPVLRHLSLNPRQRRMNRNVKRRHSAQVANTCRGALREDVQHLLARNGDLVRLIYSPRRAGARPACLVQNSTAQCSFTLQRKGSREAKKTSLFLCNKMNVLGVLFV
jgi:hypothetical protein